jgi:tetrapyrrole methylase family protein/MazG family protein
LVDGHRFAIDAAGERGPLLVAQCDTRAVLSEIKLAFEDLAPACAVVLQRLGLPDERVFEVSWADLDRVVEPDHLTSLWLPEFAAPVAAELARFHEVVRRLREECPWDRAQTHESLTRYVIEETYEVVEAIAALGADRAGSAALEEELGDLLLQVFLHSAIAAQDGAFTVADVARGITDKMVRRHPHVFGDVEVDDADHVARNWETIKAREKGAAVEGEEGPAKSVLDGVPGSLPALSYASELARKAAKIGFKWPDVEGVWDKLAEEIAELRAEPQSADELGDVLFVVVTLAGVLGHDPEGALRGAAAKFRARLGYVERVARDRDVELSSLSFDELDLLWQESKAGTA